MARPTTKNYEKNYKRHTFYITNKNFEKLEKIAERTNGGKTEVLNEALDLYFAIGEPLARLYRR